jgi:predicted TIM-barrel fold metal-dependent hydrolase
MERTGIRSVRINLGTAGDTNVDSARHRLESAIQQIRGRKWHVQVYAALPVIAGLSDIVLGSPVPVVFDHFGGARGAAGLQRLVLTNSYNSSKAGEDTSKFREPIALQPPPLIIPTLRRWPAH